MRTTPKADPALLLVEDDAEIREQMKWALASEYVVLEASDRRTALAVVRREARGTAGVRGGPARGLDRGIRADYRGERHRQGAGRTGDSCVERERGRSVRDH